MEIERNPPFDRSPVPATSVLWVASVGSSARLEIEIDAFWSIKGNQLEPPFVDFQMPPSTAPT